MRNNVKDDVSKHFVVILCLGFKTSPRAKPYENELDLLGNLSNLSAVSVLWQKYNACTFRLPKIDVEGS